MASDDSGRGISQATLDGEQIDAERVTCTKYPGCGREAEYVVEVLSYKVGEEIEVECCERCRDEFAEWVDSEKIREMTRAERWNHAE
jgi:hypothetical protein